jgi:transcriptional regulator with PAS, ATPase and Fis domain
MIIAATNKHYQKELEQKRLRQDFFYRICVIEIHVPPLRQRKDDLPLLIENFLEHYRSKQAKLHGQDVMDVPGDSVMLPNEFMESFSSYNWPGNVRELENILQRYLATGDLPSMFSRIPVSRKSSISSFSEKSLNDSGKTLPETMKAFEKQLIARALKLNDYRIGRTAESLGLPLRTLQRKIKQHRINSGKRRHRSS